MNNELRHYGVLGMKWGVRKDNTRSKKLKVGINDEGQLTLKADNKTTRKGIKNFVIKTTAFGGFLLLAKYLEDHPGVVTKASEHISKNANKNISDIYKNNSDIYSKTLGRMLTIEEAISKGLW